MKKKLTEYSPFIVLAIVVLVLFTVALANIFDKPKEISITSSVLEEKVHSANLTAAKYIQNGIAKANLADKYEGYIMYYANVRLNVDFSKITYDVDNEKKTVTPIYPGFEFDVALDNDYSKMRFYPSADITAKEALYICEEDAIRRARENEELMHIAMTSLEDTIEKLLMPILNAKGYTFNRIYEYQS